MASASASAGMASSDASQLGEREPRREVCKIRIGSFNVGVTQSMLEGKKSSVYLQKVEYIISTCVTNYLLDIMNLCEFGGHRQGLGACDPPIQVQEMQIFQTSPHPSVSVSNNYLTAWAFDAGTSQFGVRAVTDCCRTKYLVCEKCEPEMMTHKFKNAAGVTVFLGNLHIRVPSGASVRKATKQRVLKQALEHLESQAPPDRAEAPVVKVVVGDCNLNQHQVEEMIQAMQPAEGNWRTVWQVHPTSAGLGGDLIIVKGANAMAFDLPFGKNHLDRGVRHDSHDAIGIDLRVMVEIDEASPSKRNRTGDAPQPARDDASASQPARLGCDAPDPLAGVTAKAAPPAAAAPPPAKDHGDEPHPPEVRPETLPQTEIAAQPARHDDGASQPVRDPGDAPQALPVPAKAQPQGKRQAGPRNALTHNVQYPIIEREAVEPRDALTRCLNSVAASVERDVRAYWDSRGEAGVSVQRELKQLRLLLFRKKKHPVDKDLWIPGAAQPGEEQHVEAVVSEMFVLQQLKEVIELRETWLRQQGLPLDTQMRDGIERKDFLKWAKAEYHAQPFQQERQAQDLQH